MLFLQPNQKRFLSSLNPLVMVALVVITITFRSTVDPWIPLFSGKWDVIFALVIYMGQRRSFLEGGVLTLFAGHLYSLSSSAPFGVFVIYYGAIFLVSRLLTYVIYANNLMSVLGLIMALALSSRLFLWAIASSFGHQIFAMRHVGEILGYVLVNGLLGLIYYVILGAVDRITFKVPRISIELAEGGF